MNREEMISFIKDNVKHTHNEKDMQDLLEFPNEELVEIYNNILEDQV